MFWGIKRLVIYYALKSSASEIMKFKQKVLPQTLAIKISLVVSK